MRADRTFAEPETLAFGSAAGAYTIKLPARGDTFEDQRLDVSGPGKDDSWAVEVEGFNDTGVLVLEGLARFDRGHWFELTLTFPAKIRYTDKDVSWEDCEVVA